LAAMTFARLGLIDGLLAAFVAVLTAVRFATLNPPNTPLTRRGARLITVCGVTFAVALDEARAVTFELGVLVVVFWAVEVAWAGKTSWRSRTCLRC